MKKIILFFACFCLLQTVTAQQTITIGDSPDEYGDTGFATIGAIHSLNVPPVGERNGIRLYALSDWIGETLYFDEYTYQYLYIRDGLLAIGPVGATCTFTNVDPNDATANTTVEAYFSSFKIDITDGGVSLLGGITESTEYAENKILVLAYGDEGIGFYPNSAGTIVAGKAVIDRETWYERNPENSSAPKASRMVLRNSDSTTTQIELAHETKTAIAPCREGVYTISGLRLNVDADHLQSLAPGIYIINGEKRIVP